MLNKKNNANSLFAYLAMAFITMSGLSYINFLPGVVSALAGAIGFSEVEAGQIVSLNGYGGLLGTTAAIFLVRRIRWRAAVIAGLALLALMDIGSAWIDSYEAMLAWRFVAGIFGGFSLGVAFAGLARLGNPDRAFGYLLFIQFSIGALVVYLLPALEAAINAYAVFYVMASLALVSLLLVIFLRRIPLNKYPRERITLLPSEYRHAWLLLLAIMLYQVAASAIWAYVGLIGLTAGIAAEPVSTYIAVTGLLGLLGAMVPVINGKRYGRLNWLLAGVALSLLAALLLNFSTHSTIYVFAMTLLFISWPAVQSYLLAVIAEMDGSGKLATIAAVVSFVGLATGPLLASGLLNNSDFSLMLYTCAVIFLMSGLLLLKPLRAQELSNSGMLSPTPD
ncbi:MFS transporter [Pseudomonas sp. EA_35y_Pfl2_R5]|uniref:MFS transporter n=1 Tax=Pseudomonas sp. EA_35y_Pfl2_R5 TaxID=3088690 RepID=UPI0030DD4BB7